MPWSHTLVIAEPLLLDDRPHLDIVEAPHPSRASKPIELRPATRLPSARPPLTMAGVTSGLQLLLAARRAARLSGVSD